MNESLPVGGPLESGWKTYLKSAVFIAPGVLAWAFVAVFVFPKLLQMWVDAKLVGSEFAWMMQSLHFAVHNGTVACVILVGIFIVLEFTGQAWARYRRGVVGSMVFVFNSVIILGLVGACIVAAIAGPALVSR